MNKTTKVLIIYTGGTIGMVRNLKTGALEPFDFDNLKKNVPELERFSVEVNTIAYQPIDSSEISPHHWQMLIETLKQNYFKYDGFVILHGTDTMSYTSSAVSFMIENNRKPIVLTGSQLPIGQIRTDGKENLITAIEIASTYKNGIPVVPEVCISFQNKLFRGNRTHKYNSEYFDAFQSPNYPLLAEIGIDINYNYEAIKHPEFHKPVRFHTQMDTNVALIKLYPGINPKIIENIIETEGLRGLVIESYGSGNAPNEKWLDDLLKKANDKQIHILNVSQCNAGGIKQGLYEASQIFIKNNVISGKDITTEAAITKMMFLLAQDFNNEEIAFYLGKNIAGETEE